MIQEDKPKNTDENGRNERGQFTTGNTGKPKGATNKTTKQLREQIQSIVNGNWEQIETDLTTLEPKERLKFLFDLLPFILPKVQTVTASNLDDKFSWDD